MKTGEGWGARTQADVWARANTEMPRVPEVTSVCLERSHVTWEGLWAPAGRCLQFRSPRTSIVAELVGRSDPLEARGRLCPSQVHSALCDFCEKQRDEKDGGWSWGAVLQGGSFEPH